MAQRSRTPPTPQSRLTTFLVPAIHCSTCTSFIEDFLSRLHPKPITVATSIVTHSVTVEHDPSLSPSTIAQALGEAGYEVDSVSSRSPRDETAANTPRDGADDVLVKYVNKASERWSRSQQAAEGDARRKLHMQHCKQCQLDQRDPIPGGTDRSLSSSEVSDAEKVGSPFVVVKSLSEPSSISRASISISGMSCSSCVGKITAVLEQKPWVRSANVALITQSASVDFEGHHDAEELVTAIDEIGYEARLEEVERLQPPPETGRHAAASELWKASFSIEGMTCSSCVGTITTALSNLAWTRSVDVNLMTSSATVVFEDKEHLDETLVAIEDIGYGAKLNEVIPLSRDRFQNGRRTVSIQIDGIYCEHCPGRITEALEYFGQQVAIKQSPSMKKPILTISYAPNVPEFTIRDILSKISAADPAFKLAIFHPPSVADRAREMHARIRQRIFYRVLLAISVAIPTFIIGIVFMTLIPKNNPGRQYLTQQLRGVTRAEWALLIMATPVYFFGADIFHRRAIKELHSLWRRSSPVPILRRFYRFGSMDMLLSFGTTIAYFSSVADLIIQSTHAGSTSMMMNSTYFDSVVFLTMFLLIGRLIEAFSKAKTGDAVAMLGRLRPKEALLVVPMDGRTDVSSVDVDLVDSGDVIRVVHGASPPWDGILLDQDGQFDESSLTGESNPVKKAIGDPIYAGTVNIDKPVSIRTTGASGHSMLDQIIEVVQEGQARRAPIERVADALTGHFVPAVTLVAVATWIIWLCLGVSGTLPTDYLDVAVGSWPFWSLQFAIAVFVVACPCGIGLAAPTALFVGGGLAAKYGILVKGGGEAFQEASGLDIIVFDKTGTLTQGSKPKITDHRFLEVGDGYWEAQKVLTLLGRLEQDSSHPIGKAIVDFCESNIESGLAAKHVEEIAGKGMKGSFDMETSSQSIELLAGNEALMAEYGVSFDSTTSEVLGLWKGQAKSVVLVAARVLPAAEDSSWLPLAVFAASDPLRPEARLIVDAITRQGIQVWMISGDNQTTASAVGAMVNIPPERVIGGVLPQQKAEKIKYLQRSQTSQPKMFGLSRPIKRGRAMVAMVGDGVNDSPALAVADVGIAIGSGSDVAISAAEFVLVNSNLTTLLTLITLSRAVLRRVKFNFGWALVYNIAALPIAAGVLYPVKSNGQHIRLDPVWASLAMALSSISVICSSLLLRTRLPLVGFRGSTSLGAE
ncbi:hypothetical protein LTR62_003850 [Meristemomyces frigidus]|uniref:HMA domain-containing protein n=1 Tax=Meristemomyces frigidus TaxID=1508187 RepID=A0AAN7YRJ6_9PEZI|nr:hypothetical protein LTR62_003850 [Meristemomyces frigidus]